ncbi:MAG: right-handed parallel beta-helix repeat-containing protein [Kiritimatiellae bacterium]|nr:right-handed parallel beta-helix repeat-containing protein [Kiritimatiellia bacterium]
MKRLLLVAMGLLVAAACPGAMHYVVTNGTPGWTGAVDPYTNWATAGTNIIDVVNAAMTNDEPRLVLVSNGTYYLTNQVLITNALTIRGVKGREATIVDGGYGMPTNTYGGCFYLLSGGGAKTLDGFTITNGCATSGGGVYMANDVSNTVKNCRITGCVATNTFGSLASGGGAYVWRGVMTNCEVIGNINYNCYGGGILLRRGIVASCVVAQNTVYQGKTGNEVTGGGIHTFESTSSINNCEIYSNEVVGTYLIGSGVALKDNAVLRNSLIYGNMGQHAVSIYNTGGKVQNCTIVGNKAGGIYLYAASTYTGCIENVVSYFNVGSSDSNVYFNSNGKGSYQIINSCIAPTNTFPTSGIEGYYYAGNIESDPQLADKDNNNFRLAQDSPCVNAGTNQEWMTNAVDLDGAARIRYGRVDMGAYERIYHGVVYGVR